MPGTWEYPCMKEYVARKKRWKRFEASVGGRDAAVLPRYTEALMAVAICFDAACALSPQTLCPRPPAAEALDLTHLWLRVVLFLSVA